MAQARRSSAQQSTPSRSDAHGPSEGQPTASAKGKTASSTKARASQPAKEVKAPAAATRKPRGAAASTGADKALSGRGEPGSPLTAKAGKGAKRAAAAHDTTASPAPASSQATSLAPRSTHAPTHPLVPTSPTWSLLPTPRERFRAWIATNPSEQEAAEALCDVIADGGNLKEWCRDNQFSHSSVLYWINGAPERIDLYARAREARADLLADEIVAISEEDRLVRVLNPETGEVEDVTFDSTAVQRNRLRVDARKWVAAKLKPRVYGEKQTVSVGGDPDAPPVNLSHTVTFVAAQAAAPAQIVEEVTPLPKLEGGS